jgi:Galactosyltransferase
MSLIRHNEKKDVDNKFFSPGLRDNCIMYYGCLHREGCSHANLSQRIAAAISIRYFSRWMGILGLGILLVSFRAMTNQLNDSALNNNDQNRRHIVKRRGQEQEIIFQHPRNRYNQEFDEYNYNALAIATNTTLTDPHVKIFEGNSTSVLTLVLSAREHFERRQTIRETWGSGHVIYFVIGGNLVEARNVSKEEYSVKVQSLLEAEQIKNRDIIDSIHPESYASLPHKLKFALNWINENYFVKLPTPNVPEWIVKVDDDSYARITALYQSLLVPFSSTSIHGQNKILVGNLQLDAPVSRAGKWSQPGRIYPHHTYPTFALGSSGYAINRAIVKYIGEQYQYDSGDLKQLQVTERENLVDSRMRLQIYQGEDVSLGIWLEEAHQHFQEEPTLFIDSPYFVTDADCYKLDSLSIGHSLTAKQMLDCYTYELTSTNESLIEQQHRTQMSRIWFVQSQTQQSNLRRIQKVSDNPADNDLWASMARQQQLESDTSRRKKAVERSELRQKKRQSQIVSSNL